MKPMPNGPLASEQWYVVQCKVGKEPYTENILSKQTGIKTYLPEINSFLRGSMQRSPFFPGYFFIQANLQNVEFSQIKSSPGVLKLLDFGDGPLTVPQALVEEIRKEVHQRNSRDNLFTQHLRPGDLVQVTEGPFAGVRAVLLESSTSGERSRVLLHFLGREHKAQLNRDTLKKVENGSPRRERRTRGKGRIIHKGGSH